MACLGEVRAKRARPFALQVFDGAERKEGGRCGRGAARREGPLERVVVWHDLPAGKENRSESWRGKGTRESEMKTPKGCNFFLRRKKKGEICSKGHS